MSEQVVAWHRREDRALTGADLDWGPVSRRSGGDYTFRLRNQSDAYTAEQVTVDLQPVTVGVDTAHLLSLDGATFSAALNIGDLPPLATSNLITVRRVVAPDAPLGPGQWRLRVRAASWL